MAQGGRPPVLDSGKRREILAILSVGCSRRTAARYVGCSPTTIQNTADRDAAFAEELGRAENRAEIGYLKSIQKAAKKEQYWRAAAWALERRNPEDYGPRHPETVTIEELKQLLTQLTQIIVGEVPVSEFRKQILKHVGRWTGEPVPDAPDTTTENADAGN